MKLPSSSPDPPDQGELGIQALVAECLAAFEESGAEGVASVLAEHPEHAEAVHQRLDVLERLGMLEAAPDERLPERIGAYRIAGVLGRGGMGIVYEAEQETPRRRVALKVLRPDAGSPDRFRHEVELLGRLQHPGIAQIHEVGVEIVGGVTVPFFAMELVRGRPLDCFAAEEGLDARACLGLVARVCDAVHHAHQQGVMHRDLKPANILVDERGAPRVLDFGLARATDPDWELATGRTLSGQLLGTLAYMSPEQAAGDLGAIDIRTDVYSLGVIAYELLSGRRPLETASSTMLEALRAIQDDDPPRLGGLDRSLRGDVETIVAKALEKDKERRYASANDLAQDLRRFLDDQPIAARPATVGYQLGKLARRHKLLAGALAATAIALVAGLSGTLYGLREARLGRAAAEGARGEAEGRLEQAEAVIALQGEMFRSASPAEEGREARVVDVLDRAVLALEGAGHDPQVEAALRRVAGETYAALGLASEAEPHLERALELYRSELGPTDVQTLQVEVRLAVLRGAAIDRYQEADERLAALEETASRVHGAEHPVAIAAGRSRVSVLLQKGAFREAIELARGLAERLPADHPDSILLRLKTAQALGELGQHEEAVRIGREAYGATREHYGDAHPETLWAMEALGALLGDAGQAPESAALVTEALELRRGLLGDDHPDTLRNFANAAAARFAVGEPEEAEALARVASEASERRFGERHQLTLLARNNLATALAYQDRLVEALSVFEELATTTLELLGPEHTDTLGAQSNFASTLVRLGEAERAEPILAAALDTRRRVFGDRQADTLHAAYWLVACYKGLERYAEAEELMRETVSIARDVLGEDSPLLYHYATQLADCLSALGRVAEAVELFEEAHAGFARILGKEHPWTLQASRFLAEAVALQGD